MKEELLDEEEKLQKRLKKLKKTYNEVAEELGLTGDVIDDVHKLIETAQGVQCEICKAADSIRIDDYEEANKLSPIDNATYTAFVSVAAQKLNGKLTDKTIEKFETDFNTKLFIANARHSFLDTYMSGEDLKLADEDDNAFEPFDEHNDDEFQRILEHSAQTRIYINEVLYGRMKNLAAAAEYITNGDLTYKKFKMINDFEYYVQGGYPKPSTPAKLWNIYNKFNEAHRMMKRYDFAQPNALCYEFGLEITEGDEHPVQHPWMLAEDEE